MSDSPISCIFDGESFRPSSPFHMARARDAFGAGELVMLSVENERSMRSHRHYFASIREAWLNLPESAALEPWAASPEHLRKWALIKTGHHDTQAFPCTSAAEAMRWAERLRPLDGFSVVVPRGDTVLRFTAQSQSVKAMGARPFQESKTRVLDYLDDLIGTPRGELEKRGRAA